MKKIAIVTDAWHPQINGVVTTLNRTIGELEKFGYQVRTVTPQLFRSLPCPTYPEIALSLAGPRKLRSQLEVFNPHCVHIATEGPLGWAARAICRKMEFPFSTSYHTRFPEYIRARLPVPLRLSYRVLRDFHRAAARTMVATSSLMSELNGKGFRNTVLWSRGVDTDLFSPERRGRVAVEHPTFLYVGRVAVEKNIEAFLRLELPGMKIVVGDGPAREGLSKKYPDTSFVGYKQGIELAEYYATADVFVFPSLTDTFGVVNLEAMASGTPVAAFPVTGPKETVINGVNGYVDDDLHTAALKALEVSRQSCREYALGRTWKTSTRQFLKNLILHDYQLFR